MSPTTSSGRVCSPTSNSPSSSAELVQLLREKPEQYDLILYFLETHGRESFAVLGSGTDKLYLAPWTLTLHHDRPQGQGEIHSADADTNPGLRQLYYHLPEGAVELPFEPINSTA